MRPIMELTSRYRLESLIAAGGMGEVWRADDVLLDRRVAVKLLRPEYVHDPVILARFRAEARYEGQLSHPGIAQVYDYAQPDPAAAPGTVLRVSPTGRLVTGRQVLLTVAVQPSATPSSRPSSHAGPTPISTPSPGSAPPGRAKHSKGPPPGQGGNSQGGNSQGQDN